MSIFQQFQHCERFILKQRNTNIIIHKYIHKKILLSIFILLKIFKRVLNTHGMLIKRISESYVHNHLRSHLCFSLLFLTNAKRVCMQVSRQFSQLVLAHFPYISIVQRIYSFIKSRPLNFLYARVRIQKKEINEH